MTTAEFRESHAEKTAWHRSAALTSRPIDWSDLNELLYQIEPRAPQLQLYLNGLLDPERYTTSVREFGEWRRRLEPRFHALLKQGATAVMNRLETRSLAAKALCDDVMRFSGFPVASNAYLSFRGTGTFGKHWDTHDVFAIQLLGRKHWRVYAPTFPLPLAEHRSDQFKGPRPTDPVFDRVLEEGDLLYVPRGFWHEVVPLDEGSFHLSVGTYAPTIHDYLMWIAASALPGELAARQGLTSAPARQRAALEASLSALQQRAIDPQSLAAFLRDMSARATPSAPLDLTAEAGTATDPPTRR